MTLLKNSKVGSHFLYANTVVRILVIKSKSSARSLTTTIEQQRHCNNKATTVHQLNNIMALCKAGMI